MPSTEYPFVVLAALGAIMVFFLYALVATAWRMLNDEGRLRLHPMLRRHGVEPRRAEGTRSYEAALATRRCVACSAKERCDAWFASTAPRNIDTFCPNADFVRRMAKPR